MAERHDSRARAPADDRRGPHARHLPRPRAAPLGCDRRAPRRAGRGRRAIASSCRRANHPDWAIAYFGILRAGAVAVPVDPALDALGSADVLAESGARVVVWDDTVKALGPRSRRPRVDDRARPPRGRPRTTTSLVAPAVDVAPGDVASLIYTSGTTGAPEGRDAHARELHVARGGARADLPAVARRRGAQRAAAAPHLRVHLRAAPAALAGRAGRLPRRADRRPRRRGAPGVARDGDGRRAGALAAARAAHPPAGGRARAAGPRRLRRGRAR